MALTLFLIPPPVLWLVMINQSINRPPAVHEHMGTLQSKTILNSMKNIYAPYVGTSTGRQGKLSFASSALEEESCDDSSGSDVENGRDYHDEGESEESLDDVDMGEVDDDDVEMAETASN